MKKLLQLSTTFVSLLLSTSAMAYYQNGVNLGSDPYAQNGYNQCAGTAQAAQVIQPYQQSSLDQTLELISLLQTLNPPPSESDLIQYEIDDAKDYIDDLKAESNDEKSYARRMDRQLEDVEERYIQLGCRGDLEEDPPNCLVLQSRQRRLQRKADDADENVIRIQDEIADVRDEIEDLKDERNDAQTAEENEALTQQILSQYTNSGQSSGQTANTQLQGSCPTCIVQPQYQTAGVNQQQGWPTHQQGGTAANGSIGCLNGYPILPLSSIVDPSSLTAINSPFENTPTQNYVPSSAGNSYQVAGAAPINGTGTTNTVPFEGTGNTEPYAR